jgi:hypothetical protein
MVLQFTHELTAEMIILPSYRQYKTQAVEYQPYFGFNYLTYIPSPCHHANYQPQHQ